MQHQIDLEKLGARGHDMVDAIQKCVHCGFCLPTCPTYQVLGEESDSPRGRIVLMKNVMEGTMLASEAQPHLDRCLGCLACETHCPSGVPYSHLLSPFRDWTQSKPSGLAKWKRWLILQTLPYPTRMRWAMWAGGMGRVFQKWLPKSFHPMLDLLPTSERRAHRGLHPTPPLSGSDTRKAKGKVAILEGCAQRVLDPAIHQASLRVLQRNDWEVTVPTGQGCCGALAWHLGQGELASRFARHNLACFPDDAIAYLSTAAGCGSAMHEYPVLLRGTDDEPRAKDFAAKAMDILTFLDRQGIVAPPRLPKPIRVAYHDACHLAHAQREKEGPRRLLQSIPGLELISLADSDLCCGSAGTYNIDQPEIADQLGARKAKSIIDSGCDIVALANIGCEVQIERHLRLANSKIVVLHVIQLLDAAYSGDFHRWLDLPDQASRSVNQ